METRTFRIYCVLQQCFIHFLAAGIATGTVLLPGTISFGQVDGSLPDDSRLRTWERNVPERRTHIRAPIIFSGDPDSAVPSRERIIDDRSFPDRAGFDTVRRGRGVGRDRQLKDQRYYDRYEYPDRYGGSYIPDYVREDAYVPDYQQWEIQAARRGVVGTGRAYGQLSPDSDRLSFRGGGRLGAGPTGISDLDFTGAGGRDSSGRRRGVSGQSGAFGRRNRGDVLGDRDFIYGDIVYGYRGVVRPGYARAAVPFTPARVDRFEIVEPANQPVELEARRVDRLRDRIPNRYGMERTYR